MPNELVQRLFPTPDTMTLSVLAILCLLLLTAAWVDLRHQRIPGLLVFPGILLALLLPSVLPAGIGPLSLSPDRSGTAGALQGMAFAVAAWLPCYLLGILRTDDAKLLAMTGAFLGPVEIRWALLFSAFAGSLLAAIVMLQRAVFDRVFQNLNLLCLDFLLAIGGATGKTPSLPDDQGLARLARLPCGLAISAGSIMAIVYRAQRSGLI